MNPAAQLYPVPAKRLMQDLPTPRVGSTGLGHPWHPSPDPPPLPLHPPRPQQPPAQRHPGGRGHAPSLACLLSLLSSNLRHRRRLKAQGAGFSGLQGARQARGSAVGQLFGAGKPESDEMMVPKLEEQTPTQSNPCFVRFFRRTLDWGETNSSSFGVISPSAASRIPESAIP